MAFFVSCISFENDLSQDGYNGEHRWDLNVSISLLKPPKPKFLDTI